MAEILEACYGGDRKRFVDRVHTCPVVRWGSLCTGCQEFVCTATPEFPEEHGYCRHGAVWSSREPNNQRVQP